MPAHRIVSDSPAATRRLAGEVAARLRPGAVLALHGELGSGKTCFVQGLAAALGVREPVLSPTFALAGEYRGTLALHHLDLYRLRGPADALGIGIEDYLHGDGITAIEWAERAAPLLPPSTIHVQFAHGSSDRERIIEVQWPDGENSGAV